MKSRNSDYLWIPLWIDKWIFGSTRIELKLEERSIWVDFMALAAKDDGYIRANETTPYPLDQLAGLLIVPKDLLQQSIAKFVQTGKIENNDGILKIIKWEDYQLSDSYARVIKHRIKKGLHPTKQLVTENVTEKQKVLTKSDHIISYKNKEEAFIASLKTNIAYSHIDFERELAKMDAWLLLPKNKNRKKTKSFILNWLNKIDIPMGKSKPKPSNPSKYSEEELLKIGGMNLDNFKEIQ